jgi:mRNA interferase RelE/StbE
VNYQVIFTRKAAKDIRQLNRADIPRVVEKAEALGDAPRPVGSKKLSGIQEEFWRIRVGQYRIIYQIEEEVKVVSVTNVGHRKDVYRN